MSDARGNFLDPADYPSRWRGWLDRVLGGGRNTLAEKATTEVKLLATDQDAVAAWRNLRLNSP